MGDQTMAPARPSPLLAGALLILGLWGILAPYVGPSLGLVLAVRPVVEVVDHVVPGVAVLAVAVAALFRPLRLPVLLLVALAGVWMTGTHVPLLLQAWDGIVGMGTALFHTMPGVLILVLGVGAAVAAGGER